LNTFHKFETYNIQTNQTFVKVIFSVEISHVIYIFRYITTEELEQALREYGMQDGRDIKEIISEVDGDNVSTSKRGLN
jgi:hypothetical protein